MVKYSYFPGNVARQASQEVEDTMQPLCKSLGIELIEMVGYNGDGGDIVKQGNKDLQLALNARNFAIAQKNGHSIITPCASAQGIMHESLSNFKTDPISLAKANRVLEKITGNSLDVEELETSHLLHVIVDEIGLDKLEKAVVNPIDLDVACYYGPHMQRPGACGGDDPWNPSYMEKVITALGGRPIEFNTKTSSVGNPSVLSLGDSVMKMTARVLNDAKVAGAQILVSACTLSHSNLDSYQGKAGRIAGKDTAIPVVNFTEIVAFALGHHVDRYAQLRTRVLVIGS
ncbi:MAG: heterodisulfide reductase-related iron-sulfur binding cluster [Candidatus Poseidoniaceae archaeon]|jgi:heterodisulfide reductase subunit B|nr:heterodisulfide reductase-related iron-sulfur binding cluster [Candidatus Poseidoniaceae archaeon]